MTASTKRATETQRLSAGDLKPLSTIMDQIALASHFPGDAVLNGADPVIRSPHPVASYLSAPFIVLYEYDVTNRYQH